MTAAVTELENLRTKYAEAMLLLGSIEYELMRGGQTEHIRAQACRRLLAQFRISKRAMGETS